jgi:hypothetical protein
VESLVIATGHHCQLLAQRKHLEMERGPAPQEVDQGREQGNKYRFHTGNATWTPTEKSTKSMSTEFLVGATLFDASLLFIANQIQGTVDHRG